MKAKLINAYSLLEAIRESREKNPHEDSKIRANHTIEHDHIAHLVLAQPVAYDVDKIVKRLENCSDSTTFRYDKETGVLYEVEADVWARIADGTEVVIPIKSGGTNGH